jgi:LEA14-like dessication related protein
MMVNNGQPTPGSGNDTRPFKGASASKNGVMHLLFFLCLVVGLCSCSPKTPTLVPQVARVLWVGPTGLRLAIEVDVHNPNSFPIVANAIEGVVELGNGSKLGRGLAYPQGSIPAEGASRVTTQVDIQWQNLGAFAPFMMSAGPVPYVFKGSALIGGEDINISIPFQVNGQLTRAEIIAAGIRGF